MLCQNCGAEIDTGYLEISPRCDKSWVDDGVFIKCAKCFEILFTTRTKPIKELDLKESLNFERFFL